MTREKQKEQENSKRKRNQTRSQLNAYAKYSGLAFQMIAAIGLGVWGGMALDGYLGLRFPVFLVIFTLMAVTASLVLTIKSLPK